MYLNEINNYKQRLLRGINNIDDNVIDTVSNQFAFEST